MNSIRNGGQHYNLVNAATIGAAATVAGTPVITPGAKYLVVQAKFVRAAGGTTVKVYIQTSFDGGVTWVDIAQLAFTTSTASKMSAVTSGIALAAAAVPADGSLADDTILTGCFGDRFRAKYVSAGTYTGVTTLTVDIVVKG